MSTKNNAPSIPAHIQNWIELDSQAIEHNIAQFKQWLPKKTKIAAVVKANAYGHGLLEIAQLYNQSHDIAALCVINISEAIQLRKIAITKPIWVIGYLDQPYETILHYNLQVIVYDHATVDQLNQIAAQFQQKIKVHIKLDTGMHRLGIMQHELDSFIAYVKQQAWIEIVAICSHFAQSYHHQTTQEQEAILEQAFSYGYPVHSSNSHGILTARHTYDFARIGIGLYGYLARAQKPMQQYLRPVLSLKSKILQIKQIKAGDFVGYERLFQAQQDMTIATVAIGYYEGLHPSLAHDGYLLIAGNAVKIIGRICMNLTIIDISHLQNCKVGQEVIILGATEHYTVSLYDWSKISGLSIYAHLTQFKDHIPKIILQS